MATLRHRILAHRPFAALVIAAALLLRLLVPTGFMPDFSSGTVTISLCSGTGPMTMGTPADMHGMAMPRHDTGKSDPAHSGKADMPCGFGGLAAPALAGADPIQIAAAIAFVIAAGLFPALPVLASRPLRLRPPLRGPPAAA